MTFNLGSFTAAELCLGMGLSCSFQWKDLSIIDIVIFLDNLKADDEYGYYFLLAEEEGLEVTFILVENKIGDFDLDLCESRLGVVH